MDAGRQRTRCFRPMGVGSRPAAGQDKGYLKNESSIKSAVKFAAVFSYKFLLDYPPLRAAYYIIGFFSKNLQRYRNMTGETLEKYSSAITLSDMEIFVFPELMYSLLLANLMSPIIWQWRQEDCFKKLEGKGPYKKLLRLRQYIMDEFEFNLDLQTWGLTDKNVELERFKNVISPNDIEKSNALFGYHGDKYYFDADIRKHFGLDKYDGNVIPYWKTETVEAMKAFRYKPGYRTGAGECVSLSALYAAAAFIICGISLDDIYMVLTPLHSQNFIDVNGGVLTNNRRLVTKAMWFNGTEISNKAQRALRNERITIVAHNTGYIHCFYNDATIDPYIYKMFCIRLGAFLHDELTPVNMANFLRFRTEYQPHFQFCRDCHGNSRFIKAETLFHYEHGSDFRIADSTHEKLLDEVADEDFSWSQHWNRIRCDQFKRFVQKKKIDLQNRRSREDLAEFLTPFIGEPEKFVSQMADFLHINAQLPDIRKNYIASSKLEIRPDWQRQQIIDYLQKIRCSNAAADLAFYAYRDMSRCEWEPFILAAIQRNPVSIELFAGRSIDVVYSQLLGMPNESIYDAQRLAQPDEVANYGCGDGIEKAFTLANIIHKQNPNDRLELSIDGRDVILHTPQHKYSFESNKNLHKDISI